MELFSRFKRAVIVNIDSMIRKAENPEKVLNQLITEMHVQLIEAKKSVAFAIVDEWIDKIKDNYFDWDFA